MARDSDEAFILRTTPLGEADLLVVLLTRGHGKLAAVGRSARRSRKRFGGSLQPLSRVRAYWTAHPGRELARLEGVDLLCSSLDLPSEPEAFYRLAHVAELAEAFAREGEGDEKAFRLLRATVDAVADGVDTALAARYFEIWTLRLAGLLADTGRCADCGGALAEGAVTVDPDRGGSLCRSCSAAGGPGARRVPASDWAFLRLALREPPGALPAGRAGHEDRALEDVLHRSLVSYTERPLRAHRALKRLAAREGTRRGTNGKER